MAMKCPQSIVKSVAMKGPCRLKTGTRRLPVQRLNHGHYNCWTSTPLEKNSGWLSEMRHTICALGKMDKTGLHIVRCFQVKMCSFFMSPNSCIFSSSDFMCQHGSSNIMCQCLVPILLSSLSPRHPDSSSLLLCIFNPLVGWDGWMASPTR